MKQFEGENMTRLDPDYVKNEMEIQKLSLKDDILEIFRNIETGNNAEAGQIVSFIEKKIIKLLKI